MANKNKNRPSKSFKARNKRRALFAVSAALLLVAGTGAWAVSRDSNSTQPSANPNNSAEYGNDPDQQKPTDSVDPVSDIKDPKEGAGSDPAPSNGSSTKRASPTITYAGQEGSEINVNAYVSGVFEEGGTCTAAFTKSGQNTLSKSSKGFQNVSYTTCAPISIPRSAFPASGSWNLTLSYKSSKAEGKSIQQSVVIQ